MKTLLSLLVLTGLATTQLSAQAYPTPAPSLQFFDTTSGATLPCNGCTLSTFAAGTSTPAHTYADYTATTQNPVVMTLNSAGYTTSGVWLSGTCYKFVLVNAASVTIYSQDHVCAATGPAGATGAAGSVGATGPAGATGATGANGSSNVPAGYLVGANFNTTTDQAITINFPTGFTHFVIRRIVVGNASISLTTAQGGIYTASGKSGFALVASTQAYSSLSAPSFFLSATLASVAMSNQLNLAESPLYLSLTTAQGSAATADVTVFCDFTP